MRINVSGAGAERTGQTQNWGRPSGGADSVLERHGWNFTLPIKKAVWCELETALRRPEMAPDSGLR
jgi:hypothetical protein